jgi:hypothetical protein
MNEMEIEDEIQKIYEGNPSLQTKVNVNPKNNERKFAKVACPKKPHFILK